MHILDEINGAQCDCGKEHYFPLENIITGKGALEKIAQVLERFNAKKAFVLSDKNTEVVAGEKVRKILEKNDIKYSNFIYNCEEIVPDEKSVGLAVMHYDYNSEIIIGVGSGVINDICKILSATTGKPYIIVATAPSMDGYASATSSMTRDGLKISLPSRSADVIIGDSDILCNAPYKMLVSGLGDMIAKYISICEWRIAHLITGEYYCERVASLIRKAVKECVDNVGGLKNREEKAVMAVFNGLLIGGIAMNYAGMSRPASGVEHYFSHVWDMRGAEFGFDVDFHGIQCAVGTLIAVGLYEKIKKVSPNREKAINYVENFDVQKWHKELKSFLGKSAISMIELEKKEGKYDKIEHQKRLDIIIERWEEIINIVNEELPEYNKLIELYDFVGLPKTMQEIGVDKGELKKTFLSTKDIRDKYVLSRLCWDLGIIDKIL